MKLQFFIKSFSFIEFFIHTVVIPSSLAGIKFLTVSSKKIVLSKFSLLRFKHSNNFLYDLLSGLGIYSKSLISII